MKGGTLTYITLFLTLSTGSGISSVHAQDFRQLASTLRQKYEKTEKLHVVMEVQVFETDNAATPYFAERAEIKRDGVNYLSHFASNDLLMNDRYMVVVDKSSREIICSRRDLKGEKLLPDPFRMNMDSIFNIVGQPKYVERSGAIDHYRLMQKQGLIEQIDLFVNMEESFMQKIVYRYRDKQLAIIDFQVFDANPEFEPGTFDEQLYVSISKTSIRPSKNFPGYRVVNVDQENEIPN